MKIEDAATAFLLISFVFLVLTMFFSVTEMVNAAAFCFIAFVSFLLTSLLLMLIDIIRDD